MYEVLIDHLTDRLSDIGTDRQRNDYHAVLYRRAIKADFILSATGERKTGYIRDVDNTGHLRIDWEDGTKGAFGFKEIEFVT